MERLTKKRPDGMFEIVGKVSNQNYFAVLNTCLNKLATYEDAEEADLLLRLPVKVGQPVYWVINTDILDYEVVGFEYYSNSLTVVAKIDGDTDLIPAELFGETVFLTRKEAEAKSAGFDSCPVCKSYDCKCYQVD